MQAEGLDPVRDRHAGLWIDIWDDEGLKGAAAALSDLPGGDIGGGRSRPIDETSFPLMMSGAVPSDAYLVLDGDAGCGILAPDHHVGRSCRATKRQRRDMLTDKKGCKRGIIYNSSYR